MRDDSEISRVLAIAAHPDDLDFGAAGTIAAWTGAGIDVVYCIVTDSDAGGFDDVDVTGTFPRKLAALRAHESQTGHLTDLEARLRERLAAWAGRAGLEDGRLAEAFLVLETA